MFQFTKEKINNLLSVDEYQSYFEQIATKEIVIEPYDQEAYFLYTEANFKRRAKLLNQVEISKKLYNELNEGIADWTFVLLTEPWCGDASFIQPIIEAICLAGNMDLKIALRDTQDEMMNAYLTNGGKSIPKLVVLDSDLNEKFSWGPRPQDLQEKIQELLKTKPTTDEKIKLAHKWYIKDKGIAIQKELFELIKNNK